MPISGKSIAICKLFLCIPVYGPFPNISVYPFSLNNFLSLLKLLSQLLISVQGPLFTPFFPLPTFSLQGKRVVGEGSNVNSVLGGFALEP